MTVRQSGTTSDAAAASIYLGGAMTGGGPRPPVFFGFSVPA
jgi:hypothetical protein